MSLQSVVTQYTQSKKQLDVCSRFAMIGEQLKLENGPLQIQVSCLKSLRRAKQEEHRGYVPLVVLIQHAGEMLWGMNQEMIGILSLDHLRDFLLPDAFDALLKFTHEQVTSSGHFDLLFLELDLRSMSR